MRPLTTIACLGASTLLLGACATTMSESVTAETVTTETVTADAAWLPQREMLDPVNPPANRRQHYDAVEDRHYFYDPGTKRFFWEDGSLRDGWIEPVAELDMLPEREMLDPVNPPANRRQHYDSVEDRYYFYDPGTKRFFWEEGVLRDGRPRDDA